MAVRVIVQIEDLDEETFEIHRDGIVDGIIEGAETPHVEILDVIGEGHPTWSRGTRF